MNCCTSTVDWIMAVMSVVSAGAFLVAAVGAIGAWRSAQKHLALARADREEADERLALARAELALSRNDRKEADERHRMATHNPREVTQKMFGMLLEGHLTLEDDADPPYLHASRTARRYPIEEYADTIRVLCLYGLMEPIDHNKWGITPDGKLLIEKITTENAKSIRGET